MQASAQSRSRRRADPRHVIRYLKSQNPGTTALDIAKAEGVSVETVRQSIRMVEMDRMRNSGPEMDVAIRSIVIETAPVMTETMIGLLTATEMVEMPDPKTGKKKMVRIEDKTTRLEAGRLMKDLVVGLQPKAPMVAQSISQTTQVAQLGSAETNEERLERLRAKARAHNLLPPEVAGVPMEIDAGDGGEDEDEENEEEDEDD